MQSPSNTISFRPRVLSAEDSLRPTRAEVDLGAIAHNLEVVRRTVPARVLAVVKADAYGHGVVPVALRLQEEGVDGFGVALAEEGLELREAGIASDIVVLNGVYGSAHAEVLDAGLSPVVYDIGQVEAFARAAARQGNESGRFAIHLKIDTGMSRLGVPATKLRAFLEALADHPAAHVRGLMTHLASADLDDGTSAEQLRLFDESLELVRSFGHRPSVVHAANSAATFKQSSATYDMVRPGIALYGIEPCANASSELEPAMRIRTEIIAMRELQVGAHVGYHGTFVARRPTRLATVPVGYGDGLLRATSNRGAMLVGGLRCPIVGLVSMDLTTIDVTDVPAAAVGDEAVVLGRQGDARITGEELAEAAGTIPYEILTSVSRRVPRVYLG